MMSNEVIFNEKNQIGFITLNRPQALHALTPQMILAIYKKLLFWLTQSHIKAIVIEGAGEKAFCAGGDLRLIYQARHDDKKYIHDFFVTEYKLNHLIYHYPKPYIALLDGITMGGGVGVSIYGSHRIATERFIFAMPETTIGLFPDVGASFFLPRCPGQAGIYLGLTGVSIKAADAFHLKLINHYVPSAKIPELIDKLINTHFSDNPGDDITNLLQNFNTDPGFAKLEKHRPHIDLCFGHQLVEKIIDELNKHNTPWCQETLAILNSKSPISLKVTLKALRHGALIDFDQCLKTDYCLMTHFVTNHDFYEGIRAVIIDKDKRPKWQPAKLSDLSLEEVEKYFVPLPGDADNELKFDIPYPLI